MTLSQLCIAVAIVMFGFTVWALAFVGLIAIVFPMSPELRAVSSDAGPFVKWAFIVGCGALFVPVGYLAADWLIKRSRA